MAQAGSRVHQRAGSEAGVGADGCGLSHDDDRRRGDVGSGDFLDDHWLGGRLGRAVVIAQLVGPPACPRLLVGPQVLASQLVQRMQDAVIRLLDRLVVLVDLLEVGGDSLVDRGRARSASSAATGPAVTRTSWLNVAYGPFESSRVT